MPVAIIQKIGFITQHDSITFMTSLEKIQVAALNEAKEV